MEPLCPTSSTAPAVLPSATAPFSTASSGAKRLDGFCEAKEAAGATADAALGLAPVPDALGRADGVEVFAAPEEAGFCATANAPRRRTRPTWTGTPARRRRRRLKRTFPWDGF